MTVHCGTLLPELAAVLLFGQATSEEPGFLRAAHGGTLFLDGVEDLPASAQTALLRALEAKEVIPVGATRPKPVDLRIVAAARSLDDAVARGAFREELRARLRGFEVTVPPLRSRKEDLGILAAAVRARTREPAPLAPDALRAMLSYGWPDNVRELAQILSAAEALAEDGPITAAHLPARLRMPGSSVASAPATGNLDDDRLRVALVDHLQRHRGNVAAVARAMGKAPMQVHRWLKKLAVDPSRFR